ncbi:MAG: hypothetical protein WB646_08760 [Steroidobacteraceae bacterium]
MKPNEKELDKSSRWVLYHGTSSARLESILKEGLLRTSKTGDSKIALTTERSVAEYFACVAVFCDRRDHPGAENSGVVMVLDGERLLALNYELAEFRDQVWGEGECAWENEIACWDDIDPLDEVLIAVEPVPSDRYQTYTAHGRSAFMPCILPIAGFELTIMAETIGKLVNDEITPALADAAVTALGGLRSALNRQKQASQTARARGRVAER